MKTKTRTDKCTPKLIFFFQTNKTEIILDNLIERRKGKNSLIQKIRNKNDNNNRCRGN